MNHGINKVLVGDGTNAINTAAHSTATKDNMAKGDLFLLNASTHAVLTEAEAAALGDNDGVVFVAKTDEGIIESPILKRKDIKSSAYKAYTAPTEKKITLKLGDAYVGPTATSNGVPVTVNLAIRSDQKEFWNKNPSFLATFTPKADGNINSATAAEAASELHKQYTRNPFTSAGSPLQLVKVTRSTTGGTVTEVGTDGVTTFSVVKGSRTVVASGNVTVATGAYIILDNATYLVETGTTTTTFYLDTAFQGETQTLTSGDGGTTEVGTVASPTNWNLVFEAVVQPIKKWDWYVQVDFDVFKVNGFTSASTLTTVAQVIPSGTYHQVRDMERKNYTHQRFNHNFTEHPADEYVNNATVGTQYGIFTLEAATTGYGDYMTARQGKEFAVTLTIAAPLVAGEQMAVATSNSFAGIVAAWIGASASATAPFA